MNNEDFVAAFDRMPVWWQDQFRAASIDAVDIIKRVCKIVDEWAQKGIEAAEEHANGER